MTRKKWSVSHHLFGHPSAAGVNLYFVQWRWYFFWMQAALFGASWYIESKIPFVSGGILLIYLVTQAGLWKLSAPMMRGFRSYMVLLCLDLAFFMYISWWHMADQGRLAAVAVLAVLLASLVNVRWHAVSLGVFAASVVLLGVDQRAINYYDLFAAVMIFYLADYAGMIVFEAQAEYRIKEMMIHEEIPSGF